MGFNELKQKILADPYAVTDDDLVESEDCRALLKDIRAMDATLKQAMMIDVPPMSMPELPEIGPLSTASTTDRVH
ncbi:MAG: hypothetical protein AAF417_17590 [Pseudomonadota bacterium]